MKSYILLLSVIIIPFIGMFCKKPGETYIVKHVNLIPLPQKMEQGTDTFALPGICSVSFDRNNKDLISVYNFLESQLKDLYEFTINYTDHIGTINLILDNSTGNDESYVMNIDKKGIEIKAKTPRGIFYGIQSLLQILPATKKQYEAFKIPSMKITDEPMFKWRGMHLDVCRHFFSVAEIKKILDAIARLKINTFHWHLTDDQGWRIEIKKYPRLTEIGSKRKANLLNHAVEYPLKYEYKEYGGFYTQEQIKEVIDYAKSRFITVVPEIEMPGHAVAALAAYPEYSCKGGTFEVLTEWGVSDDVFCPGKDKTFTFIENILSEVIELFPGEYIHVGGDECPKIRWKSCLDCQNLKKAEKLKNDNELQSYFIKRIEKFLNSKGKKLIGWDEILEGGLPERASVMSWRGESGGIEAASNGHDVVMTPNDNCYFDHYQGKYNEPLAIGGFTSLREVYDYQPVPEKLDEKFRKHILGSQANLWTEYIQTPEHLEYMIFPRLCALAENLWTNEKLQNFEDFRNRMTEEYKRLDLLSINYRVNPPEGIENINKFESKQAIVKLDNGIPSSQIRYTIDGTEPGENSKIYKDSIILNLSQKQTLKSITIMPEGRKSQVITGTFEKYKYSDPLTDIHPLNGIAYTYYEDTVLSAVSIKARETKKGVLPNFAIPTGCRTHFFGISYNGYISIPEDGIYTFSLQSDDGSVLYIDNQMLVNNDGFHWWEEKSAKAALKKGFHSIQINYFQAKYGNYFGVAIESEKMRKQIIPNSWLFY